MPTTQQTVTNADILDRTDLIFRGGIENLKLYYMLGLPSETDEDLVAIRDLTMAMRETMVGASRLFIRSNMQSHLLIPA